MKNKSLPIPKLKTWDVPTLSPADCARLDRNRSALRRVLRGMDPRLVLFVGPCSADRYAPVMEYLRRLHAVQQQVQDQLLLMPRLYTQKPRSRSVGYLGMVSSPDPAAPPDLLRGLALARRLHVDALKHYGFSGMDELLNPALLPYFDDVVGAFCVGARSVEDQIHRQVASGASVPVGMKNPTSGDLSVLVHAINAARQPQDYFLNNTVVHSEGNPDIFAILRGQEGTHPISNANHASLLMLQKVAESEHLPCPAILIDTNHANSGKQPKRQIDIVHAFLDQWDDPAIHRHLRGFVIESYLEEGHQVLDGTTFGQSITDPCLGWEDTEALILEIAQTMRRTTFSTRLPVGRTTADAAVEKNEMEKEQL